uniref:Uncharacterized protein n=1 Tax=Pararge aegeria TaxID=116150 RepID=S4PAG6_9NEOP
MARVLNKYLYKVLSDMKPTWAPITIRTRIAGLAWHGSCGDQNTLSLPAAETTTVLGRRGSATGQKYNK